MATTSYPDFNAQTEALDVAKAFAGGIHGKTVLITGVNIKGIGYTTAEAFASQAPAHLIIAGRDLAKMQESIDALKSNFPDVDYRRLQVNLSSQKSVRNAAAELLTWADIPVVDIVVNSAAVMCLPERTMSEDGIEMHFATNYLGHFLLSTLIMPKLIKAAQNSPKGATRIINVTSLSPVVTAMRWSDRNFEKRNKDLPESEQPNYETHRAWATQDPENLSYIPLEGYNQSKVGNVLFSIGVTKRLYEKFGILSLAVHPGIIETELGRSMGDVTLNAIASMREAGGFKYKTLGAGAATSVMAALDPKLGPGETRDGKENYGIYLGDCQIMNSAHPLAVSSSEAERLWGVAEELVKEKFAW